MLPYVAEEVNPEPLLADTDSEVPPMQMGGVMPGDGEDDYRFDGVIDID